MTTTLNSKNVRISVRQGKNSWDDKCKVERKSGGVQRHGSLCRKTFPFVFSVKGLAMEDASKVFLAWVNEVETVGADMINDGEFDVSYDGDTKTFDVMLSYPKDFSTDLSTQRTEVQHLLRAAAKRVRESVWA